MTERSHPPGSSPRVLVWSADTAVSQRAVQALRALSAGERAAVESSESAEDVMAAVLDDRVDVLIADMAGASARQATALRNVKRVRPRLPVVVLASVFDDRLRSEVLPLGIHCHLLRDFESPELAEAVRSALRHAALARRA